MISLFLYCLFIVLPQYYFSSNNVDILSRNQIFAEDIGISVNNEGNENTEAFNRFMVEENDGATIIFSKGQYSFSGTINLIYTTHLVGLNSSSLNYSGDGVFLYYRWAYRSSIDGLNIVSEKIRPGSIAIRLGDESKRYSSTTHNFSNFRISGFDLAIQFDRTWIDSFNHVMIVNNNNGLLFTGNANSMVFTGCQIEQNAGTAIRFASREVWSVVFYGLVCETNNEHQVVVENTSGPTYGLVRFDSCYFENDDKQKIGKTGKYWLELNNPNYTIETRGGYFDQHSGVAQVKLGVLRGEGHKYIVISEQLSRYILPPIHQRSFYAHFSAFSNPMYYGEYADFSQYGITQIDNHIFSKTSSIISLDKVDEISSGEKAKIFLSNTDRCVDTFGKYIVLDISFDGKIKDYKNISYVAAFDIEGRPVDEQTIYPTMSTSSILFEQPRLQVVFKIPDSKIDVVKFSINAPTRIKFKINAVAILD